jgi:hypothetical protein
MSREVVQNDQRAFVVDDRLGPFVVTLGHTGDLHRLSDDLELVFLVLGGERVRSDIAVAVLFGLELLLGL